ncbi:flagellar assembly protein H [Rosistilla oblonga]|uniref:Flagellar assembly protein H n=1 Tax=Rosistilla oblonga TaxID=2527990 RepID=A0A518IME7_9BACT|nr:flagellar assembly protein H [Rosistilla oblonga]
MWVIAWWASDMLRIDPKVDFAFKQMLGHPGHPAVTIHFLNAILQPQVPIQQVEILNPIQGKQRAEDKLAVLDVLACDHLGRRFNVEMQTTLPFALPKRLLYYNCLNYVRQLSEGEGYRGLAPAISICVLDKVLFREDPRYHLSFRLRSDQVSDLVFVNDLEFHTLELPKFQPACHNVSAFAAEQKWLYLLQNAGSMDLDALAELLDDPVYREALGVLDMISKSPEELDLYEARLKMWRDEQARMEAAQIEGLERGIERGIEQGRELGIEQGRELGIEQGREQGIQQGRDLGLARGKILGRLQLLASMLDMPEPASWGSMSEEELNRVEAELREQLSRRNGGSGR